MTKCQVRASGPYGPLVYIKPVSKQYHENVLFSFLLIITVEINLGIKAALPKPFPFIQNGSLEVA